MSAETTSPTSSSSSSRDTLPFVILALCIIALLAWLCVGMNSGHCAMSGGPRADDGAAFDQYLAFQIKMLETQHADLQAAKGKLDRYVETNLPKLDEQVAKATKVQTDLEKLVVGLLDLSKTDPDAKALVTRYNIQQSKPPKQ